MDAIARQASQGFDVFVEVGGRVARFVEEALQRWQQVCPRWCRCYCVAGTYLGRNLLSHMIIGQRPDCLCLQTVERKPTEVLRRIPMKAKTILVRLLLYGKTPCDVGWSEEDAARFQYLPIGATEG